MLFTSSSKPKVLLVDDEDSLRALFAMALAGCDVEVHTAKDGVEALEKLEQDIYSLVVLDYNMPRLSGIDVIETMRDRHDETRVVLCSAYISDDVMVRAIKQGVTVFLAKPMSLKAFRETVAHQVSRPSCSTPTERALAAAEHRDFKNAAQILREEATQADRRYRSRRYAEFFEALARGARNPLESLNESSLRELVVKTG